MNRTETMLVNSPPRRWLQRYEAHVLATLDGRTPGATVAEIGCGPGNGTRLILDKFGAATVDAVDLDTAMLDRARRRLARHGGRVRLAHGSATDLRAAFSTFGGGGDGAYDAVFDFAIVHHIPNWREALAEVARVLRPGGRFYFDEVTTTALARRTYRVLFDHPADDRFTAGEFLAELPRHGLDVDDRWRTRIGGDYLLGVATRH